MGVRRDSGVGPSRRWGWGQVEDWNIDVGGDIARGYEISGGIDDMCDVGGEWVVSKRR